MRDDLRHRSVKKSFYENNEETRCYLPNISATELRKILGAEWAKNIVRLCLVSRNIVVRRFQAPFSCDFENRLGKWSLIVDVSVKWISCEECEKNNIVISM